MRAKTHGAWSITILLSPQTFRECSRLTAGLLAFAVFVLSSCALVQSDSITTIALLAPFEGRYREIGYNALYAVRLAMTDSGTQDVDLLAVDDGGTVESAKARIQALNLNPDVKAIIVLGPFASHPDVQQANSKPLIMIGYWGQPLADGDTLMVSHPEIAEQVTPVESITDVNLGARLITGDLFILEQVSDLYSDDNLISLLILSSGSFPDAAFRERYINSGLYVPEPNLLATLTYDIGRLVVEAIQTNTPITDMTYAGINGEIRFADGYWQDAPINRYRYENGELATFVN